MTNTAQITFDAIAGWLDANWQTLTVEQVSGLISRLDTIENKLKDRRSLANAALQKAAEEAKKLGFNSLEELLQAAQLSSGHPLHSTAPKTGLSNGSRKRPFVPRKPYLDPLDPNTQAWALAKHHPRPDWVKDRLSEGWTLEELHYKRHKWALAARNIQPLYDAIERHAELMQQETGRPS